MSDEVFVLDRDENPHPELLKLAISARRAAREHLGNLTAAAYYVGILHACTAATGRSTGEIVGWLDAHDDTEWTLPPLTRLLLGL